MGNGHTRGAGLVVERGAIAEALVDLDKKKLLAATREAVKDGPEASREALTALETAMNEISLAYNRKEVFLPQVRAAGDLMREAMDLIKPVLDAERGGHMAGRIIFATVKGDRASTGKDVVIAMMEADGIEVIDLGVNVSPERIVRACVEEDVHVMALSGILTSSIDSMRETVKALEESGLRNDVMVLAGGRLLNDETCARIGADAWAFNAITSVEIVRGWLTAKAWERRGE